jgi:hypothetical protein
MSNFIKGFIVLLIGSATWAFLIYFGTKWIEEHPSLPEQKFEIVDTYKGCDVVRYTSDQSAKYAYFLHCVR